MPIGMADDGVARSLFLAGLMLVSVFLGVLFFDIQDEGGNLAPVIEGDIPPNILIGSVDSVFLADPRSQPRRGRD